MRKRKTKPELDPWIQSEAIKLFSFHDLRHFGETLYLNIFKATDDHVLHIFISSHSLSELAATDPTVRDYVPGHSIRLMGEVDI